MLRPPYGSAPGLRPGGLLLALALLFPFSSPAEGQVLEGPLSPAGRLRIEVAPTVWSNDLRFGLHVLDGRVIEAVEPLGYDLSRDRFGTDVAPGLDPLQAALRDALELPRFELSLGRTRTRIQETRIRIPLRVDLGVTDWLTVGTTVPFVKRRSEVALLLLADTMTANVGISPSVSDPAATDSFLEAYGAALQSMESRAAILCGETGTPEECADAQDAIARARSFQDALVRGYGAGSLFPFQDSSPGRFLGMKMAELSADFDSLGVPEMPASLPLATGPLDRETFQEFVEDPVFGIGGQPLEPWQSQWWVGDVELHAAARILRGALPEQGSRSLRPSYLLGVGGLVRLGTGRPDGPDNFVDIGTGDGQMDVEVRAFGDVTVLDRFGLWADFRYGVQREGERVRRIAAPEVVLPPLSRRTRVSWTPGDYHSLEAAPRVHLTRELAVAGRYRYFSKARDRYALAEPPPEGQSAPDPSLLERETEVTLHQAGVSVVYSTLASSVLGRTGLPFEVHAQYRTGIAGSGGSTPKAGIFQAGVRLFWRIWGE